ncbi:putative nuclease HARBI1 [Photinus pyralis]|nr:putative nuclease HARBI1 [Photinus pyralis]XP_031337582.1 putative nuclease HARBI1 [Photinus pyralis]XP_031337587.1 putative nuclease HARBI1 [Photinus pyralis]XP_031342983.1 putative nuclease HARBI1 [Photinus pyralis]XP_031348001.1 putative nuclease HARBI1 [Photinus pyralis]XP_031348022.1 putative nuclease HARBI1 [Photinus pyralis]XP_031358902.1 putative nuclease HARBI1 [Photinus pyralis]XP_031359192.1 putative nuclease HARBI1 [Photinus pyralis]
MELHALTDDEDFLEVINIIGRRRAAKIYRHRDNHFTKWNDKEFLNRFRLSKDSVRFVIDLIQEEISHPTNRNFAVSAECMVLLALRYLATGCFLSVAGDFIGIDKSTASRLTTKVCRAIASQHRIFIKMPTTEEEMRERSRGFYMISRFPKCIGAIDCTHVKIISPGNNAEIFRNRKNFFSYNVQAVCDASLRIQNIVCRWPGSSHDSTIFLHSQIRNQFENGDFRGYLLVGDAGYAIKPYLITPLRNPITRTENLFNESQIRTRNPIERCFGVMKRRFPILSFGIRQRAEKVEAIVIATAVLHNIARNFNDALPDINEEEQEAIAAAEINFEVENVPYYNNGLNNAVRHHLIHEYFNRLA